MVLGIDASRAVRSQKTGVEWYSYFLLRAMEECTPEGWRVRCYVPSLEYTEDRPPEARRSVLLTSNPNWEWRVLRWIGRGWTQGRLSLEMLKSPPDVLFVPSHVIPFAHPERTVTTVHDVVFLAHPEFYDPEDLEDQRRGLDFALKFARKIIVPSKATKDDVVAVGGRAEQVAVIPHGVEIGDIRDSKLDIGSRSEYPISNIQSPYILFIGRIEKKKNVMNLIHAFRRLPSDVKLVLAGLRGYGADDIDLAIKTFKLEDRVVLLGWIDRVQYLTLLSHATLLVLPSFGEGFGMPVVEAMAKGVPVVCSDIPVLHEVGENAIQYVNPRDPGDIAQGIEAVLGNEMLQSEMVRRGKERAQQYSWGKTARATWEVICNTIGP